MHHVTMMATMPAKKMKTPHFMLHSMVTKHCPITKVKSCTAPRGCQQDTFRVEASVRALPGTAQISTLLHHSPCSPCLVYQCGLPAESGKQSAQRAMLGGRTMLEAVFSDAAAARISSGWISVG